MIGGVCGGLAEYLRIDPTFVRIFFVLFGLAGRGIGVFVYILLWILIPLEGQARNASWQETVRYGADEIADRTREVGEDLRNIVRQPNPQASVIIGTALIFAGGIFLVEKMNFTWLSWLDFDLIWPLLLIIGGVTILVRHFRGG